MNLKLLWDTMQDFSTCSCSRSPSSPGPSNTTNARIIFLVKQIKVWNTDLFHPEIKYTYKHSTKQYIKSS